jgi:hypothetical protein
VKVQAMARGRAARADVDALKATKASADAAVLDSSAAVAAAEQVRSCRKIVPWEILSTPLPFPVQLTQSRGY